MSTVAENTIKQEEVPVIEQEATISPEEPTPSVEPVADVKDVVTATEEPTPTVEAPPVETEAEVPVNEDVTPNESAPVPEVVPTEEAVAAEATEAEPTEVIQDIKNGSLFKRGPRPLRLWKNRYFAFHSEAIPLEQLRLVSKKYTKALSANKEEFEKVNSSLFHDIASATVSGEGLLLYYKSSNPDHVEVPLGIVNLSNVESVSPMKASKPHAFSVKTQKREYVLAAHSADEAKSWVHAIQSRIDSLSSLPNPAEAPQYKETYDKLVSRQAFNPKTTPPLPTGILSDNEILSGSDNEPENRDGEHQATPDTKVPEIAPEEPVAEEVPVVAEAHEAQHETSTLKSRFINFKSMINKKIEKQPEVPVPVEAPEVQEPASEPTPEAAENEATVAEEPVKTEAPVADGKKEEHPVRPLSFHLPKFFKGLMKEEKPEATAEQAEAPAIEVAAETPIVEAAEETPEKATEEPETTPEQQPEVTRPESPIRRTISNFLHLKKGKQVEVPQDSAEVEIRPPVAENDNLEKPLEIVNDVDGEVAAQSGEDVAQTSNTEQPVTEEAAEKPKKPTLFKRLSSMVRPIAAPKAPQPAEEPIPEANGEQPPAVSEPIKAN